MRPVALSLALAGCLACGTKGANEGTDKQADAESPPEPAVSEPAAPEPAVSEPEPSKGSSVLTLTLRRTDDPYDVFEFEASSPAQTSPLEGLVVNDCETRVPCGWARLCKELGLRWLDQIGVSELKEEFEAISYTEADCGEAVRLPVSGDFVASGWRSSATGPSRSTAARASASRSSAGPIDC